MNRIYSSGCLSFLLVALVAACGSNDGNTSPSDDAAGDASDTSGDVEADLPDGADVADNDVADDTSETDETNTDVDTTDTIDDGAVDTADVNNTDAADDVVADVDTDAGDDVDVDETTPDTAPDSSCEYPACEYLDLDIWLVRCGETWKYGRTFSDLCYRSECAAGNWVVLDGVRYDTVEDAYAATTCDVQCELRAATSASFVHCERRNGYIVYESPEVGCPAIYEFSDGFYNSYEEWLEANPCE